MLTWGNWYWPTFLIISGSWLLSAFGIPESIALITEHGPNTHLDNTLSYYSRVMLHADVATNMSVHTAGWWLSFIVWMMFVVFITAHIWFLQFG